MDVMYELPETEGPTSVTVRASDIAGDTVPAIVPAAAEDSPQQDDVA